MSLGLTELNLRITHAVRANRLEIFHKCALLLHTIWQTNGRPRRLGLAISGGVDSMALAFLCSEIVKANSKLMEPLYSIPNYPRTPTSLSAFIVDHRMREESNTEAKQVATELTKLGVEPHVLELDWRSPGDPSQLTNVETAARTLRYQVMGRACRDKGIRSLLLAHHGDDQHETVLSRIFAKYLGTGLHGIDVSANIPDCTGIHGVDESGQTDFVYRPGRWKTRNMGDERMLCEGGGVSISRPLLSLQKKDLVQICEEHGVKWFEDHTNNDPTLTIRNTFRHLIKGELLPQALSRHRIWEMADKVLNDYRKVDKAALELLRATPLRLDLRSGVATFFVKKILGERMQTNHTIHAMAMRKMLEIVSCKSAISLHKVETAVDFVFSQDESSATPKVVSVAGVEIFEDPLLGSIVDRAFVFRRSRPERQELKLMHKVLWPTLQRSSSGNWSEWILWDGRYWIRVRPPEGLPHTNLEIVVRFLTESDVKALRVKVPTRQKAVLEKYLRIAKGSARFTLPVIVATDKTERSDGQATEEPVALPTLSWGVDRWKRDWGARDRYSWLWDVRFKHVDLDVNGLHKVVSSSDQASDFDFAASKTRKRLAAAVASHK